MHKTGQSIAEVLWYKHLNMRVTPLENPTCAAFKKYGKVPKKLPLDFTEDDVMWVASNLSGAAGALGAEVIEMRNWLLRFGCTSEELRVFVASLAHWVANSSTPWAAYHALIACRLVALHKRPGLRPMGIGNEGSWGTGEDSVWEPSAVRRPPGRHRGIQTRFEAEETRKGQL